MWGASKSVVAISGPHVRRVVPVTIRTRENNPRGKDDGLKMCARRPSLFHLTSSLTVKPMAIIRNCQ